MKLPSKILFLFSCLIIGFIFLAPQHNVQLQLAQGDHGRDLYCFQKTFEGSIPYRDYWWQYGPLMPYYYGLSFHVFGVSIQTVISAQLFLVYLSGILIFLMASRLMSAPLALIASLWYWAFRPDFFYTYNHIGGFVLCLAAFYCLLKYYDDSKGVFLCVGLGAIFLLNLVRLNIGISCLIAYVGCLFLMNRGRPRNFFMAVAGVLILTAAVYYGFIHGLSPSALKQCFPYLSEYRPDTSSPLNALTFLGKIIMVNFTATWSRKIFAVMLLAAIGYLFYIFTKSKNSEAVIRDFKFPSLFLLIFLVVNLHEYLFSASIFRLTWAFPFGLLLMFLILDRSSRGCPKALVIVGMIFLALVAGRTLWGQYQDIQRVKQPVNLLQEGRTRVYVNPDFGSWIATVQQTLEFLRKAAPGEKTPILAIPYDGLYYFLSGRDSAVYPLAFFRYIHISNDDERIMIEQIKEKNVRWILLSSRSNSFEAILGVWGKDYCPLLARYIEEHFHPVADLGDWQNPVGFIEGHGIRVLEAK